MLWAAVASFAVSKVTLDTWVTHDADSLASFTQNAAHITTAMVTYAHVGKTGEIEKGSEWTAADLVNLHQTNVRLLATLTNYSEEKGDFDGERMSKLLASPELVDKAAKDLSLLCKKDGFDGVDLDIESMSAADRAKFSTFVQALYGVLHAAGLRLSTTVHPKESEPGTWNGPQAQDWKAIGASTDDFRIMCYDFSWSTGPEGAIAPTDWVTRVASFALTQVPQDKISIGVAWYGYDWSAKPAKDVSFPSLPKTLFTLDPLSSERVYEPHVHFAGADSFRAKVDACGKLGLTKFSAWRCGGEDPAIWDVVSEKSLTVGQVSESVKPR